VTAGPLARLALAAALVAVAALAWLGYRQPELVLWLGGPLFFCA
jgi:hypothetical protein